MEQHGPIPLNHEASAGQTHQQTTSSLPPEVVQCLDNNRFLHLATCSLDAVPHVSLMNYTYLPTSPFSSAPVIVMTSNPASRKMLNLAANPRVSLLVHDWSAPRPITALRRLSGSSPDRGGRGGRGTDAAGQSLSPLATLLFNLNNAARSSISATISGPARLVDRGSDVEAFYRARHLENNAFEDEPGSVGGVGGAGGWVAGLLGRGSTGDAGPDTTNPAGGSDAPVDGFGELAAAEEEVRLIEVEIKDVRIADWKGGVKDWAIVPGHTANGIV